MKVLIGTPIHEIKHYSIERWLKNVAELVAQTPAKLFLVDNSPDLSYMEKVKKLCSKYGISDYEIVHIDVWQLNGMYERIGRSREVIRQYLLDNGYDAWFSWESDQIIPPNTLQILSKIMGSGKYSMVHPNAWSRENPNTPEANFGVCLISRNSLEKFGFLVDLNIRSWYAGEAWFKKRVIADGGSYIEIYGIIKPIIHLSNIA